MSSKTHLTEITVYDLLGNGETIECLPMGPLSSEFHLHRLLFSTPPVVPVAEQYRMRVELVRDTPKVGLIKRCLNFAFKRIDKCLKP